MVSNGDNTVAMSISRRENIRIHSYKINSNIIQDVHEFRYVGGMHINAVVKKAPTYFRCIRRRQKYASPDTKLLTYTTLPPPVLEYTSPVRFPFTRINIQNLDEVQRLAIRFITNKIGTRYSPSELCRGLRVQPLEKKS